MSNAYYGRRQLSEDGMPKESSDKALQIGFRCPIRVRDAVQKLAEAERRSLNAQILVLVEEALDARAKANSRPTGKR